MGSVTNALAALTHTVAVTLIRTVFDTAICAMPASKADTVALVAETLTCAVIQTLFELTAIALEILVTMAKTCVVVTSSVT